MPTEAHYRFEVKVMSRGADPRSVVAKAAYRSGSELRDYQTDRVYNYRSRSQEVVSSTILAPGNAPEWMRHEETLWNGVEEVSTRKNARMAREVMPSLPVQLSEEQQEAMLHSWAEKELVHRGMVAQISIHRGKGGSNPHAHILCTTREIDGDRFGKVVRDWNEVELLKHWRESYADAVNAALEKANREERVDHRSLADRGIDDRLPEPKIGAAAMHMHRSGKVRDPDRVREARRVRVFNQVLPQIREVERDGEVPQEGLGMSWRDRAGTAVGRFYDRSLEFLEDESSGGAGWRRHLENKPRRDTEPDLSR